MQSVSPMVRSVLALALFALTTVTSSLTDAQPARNHARSPRRPTLAVARPAERTRARRLGLGTREVADTLLHDRPRPAWVIAARGRPTRRYLWPVLNGIATQGFHAQEGRHQALDIGAPCGTPIRVGHGGVVAFSGVYGNAGNTVVVVHAGGWVTAYGHARRTLVAAGALVRRGQVIAEVGDTGDAHGCHVHFIVARNGRRMDPEQHVSGRPRSARAPTRTRTVALRR
jgi:murein DD-endopeptidase MepM/ murein hydrolase activator NlpD